MSDLRGAKIAGQLNEIGAVDKDHLDFCGMTVSQHLLLRKAGLSSACLSAYTIGGQFDMDGVPYEGELQMCGININGDFNNNRGPFGLVHVLGYANTFIFLPLVDIDSHYYPNITS